MRQSLDEHRPSHCVGVSTAMPILAAPSLRPLPGAEGSKGHWAGEAAENLPVRKGGEDAARDGAVHEPRLLAPVYTLHCPRDFTYKTLIRRENS